jgi:hypothetical protein
MAQVGSYNLLFYGSLSGYQTNRAQARLSGPDGRTLAWTDSTIQASPCRTITRAGPSASTNRSTMFDTVIEVLSIAGPLHIFFVRSETSSVPAPSPSPKAKRSSRFGLPPPLHRRAKLERRTTLCHNLAAWNRPYGRRREAEAQLVGGLKS